VWVEQCSLALLSAPLAAVWFGLKCDISDPGWVALAYGAASALAGAAMAKTMTLGMLCMPALVASAIAIC